MAKEKKATLKSNGNQVTVYRSKLRPKKWINSVDCTTEYDEHELNFN